MNTNARFWTRTCFAPLAALALFLATSSFAQTVLFNETFEGFFPSSPWVVGDTNPASGIVFWDDVNSGYGSIAAHGGNWKGYCAALSNTTANATATYSNSMNAFMARPVNLTGFMGGNVEFWYAMPSIETCCDRLRVWVNSNLVFNVGLTQSTWARMTLPIVGAPGSNQLRFEFYSDGSVQAEGAYLDDIVVRAHTAPWASSLVLLSNANYGGYVLANDTALGRSNIQAQAQFNVENFTGTNTTYSNVLSFRLVDAATGLPHPIYDQGNAVTNTSYTYNVTNTVALLAGTNTVVTNTAFIRPAAFLSQLTQYYLECKLITNGVVAQTLTGPPQTFYHFQNLLSGDASYNVLGKMTNGAWTQTFAVQTVPAEKSFQVQVDYELRRWDDIAAAISPVNVPVVFNLVLRDQTGALVPLATNALTFYDALNNYVQPFIVKFPAFLATSKTLDVYPASQLDSVNKRYYLTVTMTHTNSVGGGVVTANTLGTTTNELLHFNGNLLFGTINTRIDNIGAPPPVNPPGGGVIPTTLNPVDGTVTGSPTHTFTGGAVNVNLTPAGDAIVTGGAVAVNAPSPDADVVANVRFTRGPVTLSSAGAFSTVRMILPNGLGYRLNNTSSKITSSVIQFGITTLDNALNPASDLTYLPGVAVYGAEESKPAWLVTDRIIWHISSGKFDLPPTGTRAIYVRATEYALLQSVSNSLVDPPSMADKRSNERYWLSLSGASSLTTVRTDGGSNAQLSADFTFDKGGFRAHFPYNTHVAWTASGAMKVTDDFVTPSGTSSLLSGATPVSVPYTKECPGCAAGALPPATPQITSSNGVFSFTRDGGIVAGGPTTGTVDLQWGYISSLPNYAQQALTFTEGAFHMPGAFIRGDQNLLPDSQGPTTILYTGFAVSNLARIERPLSTAYSQGLADYAGLNFRCLVDSAHNAKSTIAGTPNITWKLDARSKYYVRFSGVTGIHEAVPGTFPSNLTLWGYDFTFTSYGLSYRDSQNIDSVTDGAISLPYPSSFVQNFEEMKFSCLGAPLKADVPANDPFKVMSYWQADFKTHAITFAGPNACDPTQGYLVLGIEGYASHVDKPLYGSIGYFPNGDHIPKSFGLAGVTSRLKLPNVIKIDGPNDSTYSFTPCADAYYNIYASAPPGPTAGWQNIFGKMDVPFFEDMQLHLQTSCHTNGTAASNAPIYLSGGWPRAGTSNPNYGWLDGSGRTPFETNSFDWANRGWPATAPTIADYRDNNASEQWHPRAQRLWLGVVEFDYPLSWNTTLRSFKSLQQVEDDFFVLHIQHEVTYMDAKECSLDFGAQYDGLPKISIANMAFNALDEATGVAHAIVDAATQPVFDLLETGLDQLNQALDTQMNRLMDGVFDRTVDPIIDKLYTTLSNQWAVSWNSLGIAQKQQFLQSVSSNAANILIGNGVTPITSNMTVVLTKLGEGVGAANNLIGQVETYLGNASNAIGAVVDVITVTTNGQPLSGPVTGLLAQVNGDMPILPGLVGSLVEDIAPEFINAVLGPTLSNVLADVQPQISTVVETLETTKNTIAQVESQLHGVGDFVSQVDDTIKSATLELSNVSYQVSLQLTQHLGQLDFNVDNPFTHINPDDLKKFIRQKVEDEFYATTAAQKVQEVLRQQLYDVDAALREQIDTAFEKINDVMRELISQSLAELDNSINSALGDVSDVMGAGKISGHALINGDSLKLLRIDAHFEWKAPDSMEFNAFLEIKEYDSDGTPGCSSASGSFTEVTLGATDVSLDWISPDLSCNIATKFTFDGTVPFPVNFAGSLELNGDLSFETFVLHDLAAALAFGKYENYLALKGGVRFNGYDFSGAIFFGRTCTLDPIKLIDPDVAEVLGNPPFTGAYVYAQGWLPVSELVLGIPASCLFEISAGVGAGAFYFVEGPTYGGKMFLGVYGSLLCIVSIEGDITMIGVKHGDDLRFKGKGHFEAEIGPCPFCISISKDVSISYINKSWHFD